MVNLTAILRDGAILSAIASVILMASLRINPRSYLQDYPPAIQALVPPKTPAERRLALIVGIPFMILLIAVPLLSTLALKRSGVTAFLPLALHAFGVVWIFNVVDWLVLDWLIFCAITPAFVVIPGSEGHPAYKDYGFHFRGFLKGSAISAAAGLLIGGIVALV